MQAWGLLTVLHPPGHLHEVLVVVVEVVVVEVVEVVVVVVGVPAMAPRALMWVWTVVRVVVPLRRVCLVEARVQCRHVGGVAQALCGD